MVKPVCDANESLRWGSQGKEWERESKEEGERFDKVHYVVWKNICRSWPKPADSRCVERKMRKLIACWRTTWLNFNTFRKQCCEVSRKKNAWRSFQELTQTSRTSAERKIKKQRRKYLEELLKTNSDFLNLSEEKGAKTKKKYLEVLSRTNSAFSNLSGGKDTKTEKKSWRSFQEQTQTFRTSAEIDQKNKKRKKNITW